ncbi:MAG: hypothetical protein KC505_06395 [Myxococcales bacterium]|nr:hypothetical protein [Myxococcales bacterium]USN51016.1 MAG: hypothetical protein H6731_00970 [Myxococcales bacterium]
MPHKQTRSRDIMLLAGRALLCYLFMFFFACDSCSGKMLNSQKAALSQGQSLAPETFFDLLPKTCGRVVGDTPFLLASFSGQTAKNLNISLETILSNTSESVLCPPGPFLVDGAFSADSFEAKWKLKAEPDYFLWYMPTNSSHYDFYLTDQNGFPLKSQSIKLEHNKDSLLVLFPKATLERAKTYFLYLKQKDRAWIQPLEIYTEN